MSGKATHSNTTPAVDLSSVPEEYHEFVDVFSRKKADTLPPHRSYDLKIELEEGASPPPGCMYSLSPTELEALRVFIDENLSNGFIRPSNSPHRALILFVKKKSRELWLCIDYCGLNRISKKDRYRLPLRHDTGMHRCGLSHTDLLAARTRGNPICKLGSHSKEMITSNGTGR